MCPSRPRQVLDWLTANWSDHGRRIPARVSRDKGNVGALRVHGKGCKESVVTLNYKACRTLKAYLAVRPKIDEEHLFLTKQPRMRLTRKISIRT
jgi:site-specific recombinase XerC